jgi:glutamine synthetase
VTRAEHVQESDRCNVSNDDVFQAWLQERKIEDVEAFVPDMAGSARGKVIPADEFGSGQIKMPEAIFSQTLMFNI